MGRSPSQEGQGAAPLPRCRNPLPMAGSVIPDHGPLWLWRKRHEAADVLGGNLHPDLRPKRFQAKADEIVVTGALSTNLLVQAALDHGVTEIISELVSNRYGHALYKIAVPQACAGRPFLDVFTQLKTDQNLIVVAVGSHTEGKFLANPPNSYIINTQDQLVVIGQQRPD